MAEGWVKTHRSLSEHPMWLAEKFTRGQAWMDLIMLANHRPGHIRIQGVKIDVQRGDVGWSEVSLAARWKWSRGKVRRFMAQLAGEQMLISKRHTGRDKRNYISTIANYEKFQGAEIADGTSDDTRDGHATDMRQYTNKNEKNEKKKDRKGISFVEGAPPLRLATYLLNCIRLNRPEFKQPDLQAWAAHVDLMIRIDKRDPDHIREVIKWAQSDNMPQDSTGFCWAANILSTSKLRKQFDQLAIKMNAAQQRAASPPGASGPRPTTVRDAKLLERVQIARMMRQQREGQNGSQGTDLGLREPGIVQAPGALPPGSAHG